MTNVIEKLEQLKQLIQITNDEQICDKMDIALDEIQSEDFFGTEGQCDPRGDQREAPWTPYDPDDEDSDGDYEYFRCENAKMAIDCIDYLIQRYNEMTENKWDKPYQPKVAKMYEEAFSDIFKEYGLL